MIVILDGTWVPWIMKVEVEMDARGCKFTMSYHMSTSISFVAYLSYCCWNPWVSCFSGVLVRIFHRVGMLGAYLPSHG